MSNARFSILQARAVKDRRISDSQFRTLAALGMYADEDGWCFPSLGTLGKDLSKSKQAVGRDTIALRKLGYLEVKPRFDKNGSRRSSLYRLKYDLPPVNVDDSTPSTSEVDGASTSEVDVNDPINDQKKKNDFSELPKTDETKGDYTPHGTAYNRGEQERPDKVAEMLAMMNFPGAKKNARIEALQSAFGVAFVVNSESKEWREFAKYAIEKQDSDGWKPETFIAWVKQQKGYPDYWSCKRMRENYPKAFIQETQEEKVKLL